MSSEIAQRPVSQDDSSNTLSSSSNEHFSKKTDAKKLIELIQANKTDLATVRLFAHAVCRDFLGGAWRSARLEHLIVEKITGGLTNYLYKCELNAEMLATTTLIHNEPDKILLRLYGEGHANSWDLLKDVLVSAMMSDKRLGPKIYGVFKCGRLEELINAQNLDTKDICESATSRSLATLMAQFHTLEMPFTKEPTWLFDIISKFIKVVADLKFTDAREAELFDRFVNMKMDIEFDRLREHLESLRSDVVFCHNDINVGNVLRLPDKLMLIDYEYSNYNYRGFDIGNHFCEWMMNNNHEHFPFFEYDFDKYPSRVEQLNFLNAYCATLSETTTNTKSNEVWSSDDLERIRIEANEFALASSMMWALWAVVQASTCKINFSYLDYALARCDAYFRHKADLFPNGF